MYAGAVNTSTSKAVSYAYAFQSNGSGMWSRPASMTYPNGHVLNYGYGSGLDSRVSRLNSVSRAGTTVLSLSYLGAGTVVERANPATKMTFIGTGTGEAAAIERSPRCARVAAKRT